MKGGVVWSVVGAADTHFHLGRACNSVQGATATPALTATAALWNL
jgi:hypothetical protein